MIKTPARKKPFSGKAKKQQLQERRERHRIRDLQRLNDDEQEGQANADANMAAAANAEPMQAHEALPPAPVLGGNYEDGRGTQGGRGRGRGSLTTMFERESKQAIHARKRDAFRPLRVSMNAQELLLTQYGLMRADMQPPMLRKPQWQRDMALEELDQAEKQAYKDWIEHIDGLQQEKHVQCNLFERNLNVWRELWRTIERSNVLVHLADARCPVVHLSHALITYIRTLPAKRMVIVLTKTDLVPSEHVEQWQAYLTAQFDAEIPVIAFDPQHGDARNVLLMETVGCVAATISAAERTTTHVRADDKETLVVGFVGEPNVGKSSLLNSLMEKHVVAVSATPGRTKHLQTHYYNGDVASWGLVAKETSELPQELKPSSLESPVLHRVLLCDCPGIVFPRLNVPISLQIVFGSFPIAQVREPFSAVRFIAEHCDPSLQRTFNLSLNDKDEEWTPYTLCEAFAKLRGFHMKRGKLDINRAANMLLRDALNGENISLSFTPLISDAAVTKNQEQSNGEDGGASDGAVPKIGAKVEVGDEEEKEEPKQKE